MELDLKLAQLFLARHNFHDCHITKIAGDASFRSYYRVMAKQSNHDQNYILMFAPRQHEDIKPFVKIDNILLENGFSAPQIIAKDDDVSFILLEDFGDQTYNRFLQQNLSSELKIYQRACDVLVELHKISLTNYQIAKYNNAVLYREVALFIDWYLPYKGYKISNQQIRDYKNYWFELFDKLNKANQVLVLRDYHADNLMILNDRISVKAVGLLDFQDALIGSNAYDLVSLLEDARREIEDVNRKKLFDYFVSQANYDYQEFLNDYEIISLQRNIKILGIFARLFMRDGKKQYLNYLPRVENFVKKRIAETTLINQEFKGFLNHYL